MLKALNIGCHEFCNCKLIFFSSEPFFDDVMLCLLLLRQLKHCCKGTNNSLKK